MPNYADVPTAYTLLCGGSDMSGHHTLAFIAERVSTVATVILRQPTLAAVVLHRFRTSEFIVFTL